MGGHLGGSWRGVPAQAVRQGRVGLRSHWAQLETCFAGPQIHSQGLWTLREGVTHQVRGKDAAHGSSFLTLGLSQSYCQLLSASELH